MMQYIYDFLSTMFDKLKDREKVRAVILFGSFARGNQRKDSDVDLFIDVRADNKEEVEQLVKESLQEFEIKIENVWKLEGINNAFAIIVDDISLKKWEELRKDIGSYGILIYGRYETPVKYGKRLVLIDYDLSKSKQKDKMRIIRALLGYKLKRGEKVYEQRGIIKKLGAEKLSNSILADTANYKEIYNLLKKEKIPVKIRPMISE